MVEILERWYRWRLEQLSRALRKTGYKQFIVNPKGEKLGPWDEYQGESDEEYDSEDRFIVTDESGEEYESDDGFVVLDETDQDAKENNSTDSEISDQDRDVEMDRYEPEDLESNGEIDEGFVVPDETKDRNNNP